MNDVVINRNTVPVVPNLSPVPLAEKGNATNVRDMFPCAVSCSIDFYDRVGSMFLCIRPAVRQPGSVLVVVFVCDVRLEHGQEQYLHQSSLDVKKTVSENRSEQRWL